MQLSEGVVNERRHEEKSANPAGDQMAMALPMRDDHDRHPVRGLQ